MHRESWQAVVILWPNGQLSVRHIAKMAASIPKDVFSGYLADPELFDKLKKALEIYSEEYDPREDSHSPLDDLF